MQKRFRLKNSASFSYIYRKGQVAKSGILAVYAVPASNLKVGVSVSKKVGNSVCRSLVKRRVSEAFRAMIPQVEQNFNFVVNTYPAIANADYRQIADALELCLTRLKKWKREGV